MYDSIGSRSSTQSSIGSSSACNKPTINYTNVNGQEENNKNVIQQSEDSKDSLRNDVERWNKVHASSKKTKYDTNPKHIHKASNGEEFIPQVP